MASSDDPLPAISSSSEPSPTESHSSSQSSVTGPSPGSSLSGSASSFSSSHTSFSSAFDAPHPRTFSFDTNGDRRTSAGSMTSWMESDVEDNSGNNGKNAPNVVESPSKEPGSWHDADQGIEPHLKSSSSQSDTDGPHRTRTSSTITTPHTEKPMSYDNHSPASSTTGSSISKDGPTPRAELPPPVWPLSQWSTTSKSSAGRMGGSGSTEQGGPSTEPSSSTGATLVKRVSLKREGSWRKKHTR
jgi:hypothetical protein